MARKPPKADAADGPRLVNRRAWHEYEILERIEAGIALKGTEVKSLRLGEASISDAFARIDDVGRVTLLNFQIEPYKFGTHQNHEPKRPKQLLLHKREIKKLATKVQIRGQTLVPLSVYFKTGRAKVELALARGKCRYDKRQAERKRQDQLEMARARRRGGL